MMQICLYFRQRAYFEEISILVPTAWDTEPSQYGVAGKESFDKSDIVVDLPSSQSAATNRPFTMKTTPCGEPGQFISLTPDFFTSENPTKAFGPRSKVSNGENVILGLNRQCIWPKSDGFMKFVQYLIVLLVIIQFE